MVVLASYGVEDECVVDSSQGVEWKVLFMLLIHIGIPCQFFVCLTVVVLASYVCLTVVDFPPAFVLFFSHVFVDMFARSPVFE